MNKVSIFKNFLNRETIVNCGLDELALIIKQGRYADVLSDYRCYSPMMLSDKSSALTYHEVKVADIRIPRICFSSVYKRRNGARVVSGHNNLLFIEIAGLKSFNEAVRLRRVASRQPYTRMTFVGANGMSVIIVCCISQKDGTIPGDFETWRRLMSEGYRLLHYVYSSQLRVNIPLQACVSDAMCLMSADAGVYYNANSISMIVSENGTSDIFAIRNSQDFDDEESPLPGMTAAEAYRYIFYCCWNRVLDSGLNSDDDYFVEKSIQMLARCVVSQACPSSFVSTVQCVLMELAQPAVLLRCF